MGATCRSRRQSPYSLEPLIHANLGTLSGDVILRARSGKESANGVRSCRCVLGLGVRSHATRNEAKPLYGQPLAASRLGFQSAPRPNTPCVVQTLWKILSVPERAFRMTVAQCARLASAAIPPLAKRLPANPILTILAATNAQICHQHSQRELRLFVGFEGRSRFQVWGRLWHSDRSKNVTC